MGFPLPSWLRWRWWLVVAGALAMGMAGTYQFLWSSIRDPLGARLVVSEATLGTMFTVFIIAQTVSQFPAGWVRDRYGPRLPLTVGTVCLGVGFVGLASVTSVPLLLVTLIVGGVGAGMTYTVAINTPVKWFTDRRGLATGIVAMTFGGASFLLIPVVRTGVSVNFGGTLLGLAALVGVGTLTTVVVIRDPGEDSDDTVEQPAPVLDGREEALGWRETIGTWQFPLLYVVFVVVNAVGLMLIGKVVTFAGQLELSAAAATGSASIVALADAGGVIAGGAVADRIGAERTSALTLLACGGTLALTVFAGQAGFGIAFVALAGLAAFFRSPVFAIFPALVGEYYGAAFSSENYAVLYTAKLWGGVGGGVAASLAIAAVGWSTAFLGAAVLVALSGLLVSQVHPGKRTRTGSRGA